MGGNSGFGPPSHEAPRARRSEPQSDPLNDLRADAAPWRSDVMLEAIERAIDRYQRIVSAGGWPPVPGPRMIRPGDDDERVPALRRRLRTSGDLGRGSGYENYSYDGEVEAAVRRFQARHGCASAAASISRRLPRSTSRPRRGLRSSSSTAAVSSS